MTIESRLPAPVGAAGRLLTADAFQRQAEVPPEIEWLASLGIKAGDSTRLRMCLGGFQAVYRHRPSRGVPLRHSDARHRLA